LIYLRARYMDPKVGRFLTKDVWQGDYSRPLSLNGWNYVEGNPINRVDPSGQISCLKYNDADCQARAQILLNYAKVIKQSVIPGNLLPVEGFAKFVDFAMWLFNNDISGMMWGTTNVLLGVDPNEHLFVWFAVPAPPEIKYGSNTGKYFVKLNWLPYRNVPSKDQGEAPHSERGDWKSQYWDGTANQAYHFWYSVATTYYNGARWGMLANMGHDPYFLEFECLLGDDLEKLKDIPILGIFNKLAVGTSQEDFNLSLRGIELGKYLSWADILYSSGIYNITWFPGTDPGKWIRNYLKE
jgi:hypothetical protein